MAPLQLFQRRLETVLAIPDLKKHQHLIQGLGVDGMSSDEEDYVEGNSRTHRHPSNPNYHVLTPRWRSQELTDFLHVIDSLYILFRRLDSSRHRGNWPRPRRYDALNPTFSPKRSWRWPISRSTSTLPFCSLGRITRPFSYL